MLAAFGITGAPKPDLSRWEAISSGIAQPEGEVTIAIVGKYTGLKDAYKSLMEALVHGGIANRVKVKLEWIESEIFEREDAAPYLEGVNGILVPGGFGERGSEGKVFAVKFARQRGVPYFGICFGMQMACLEAARSLAGIEAASSTEFGETPEPVIAMMTEWMRGNELEQRRQGGELGGTMRLGAYDATLAEGSRIAKVYGTTHISERHRHRYEVNMRYRTVLEQAGLRFRRSVAGRSAAGDGRISRPPLVHRRAVSPRIEITPLRAPSAICGLHRGSRRAKPVGLGRAPHLVSENKIPAVTPGFCNNLLWPVDQGVVVAVRCRGGSRCRDRRDVEPHDAGIEQSTEHDCEHDGGCQRVHESVGKRNHIADQVEHENNGGADQYRLNPRICSSIVVPMCFC